MKQVFVDTSGWATLFDARQELHEETKAIYHLVTQENSRLVTTNYIIAELVALLTSPLRIPRPTVVNIIRGIKTSSLVENYPHRQKLGSAGLGLTLKSN